MNPAKLDLLYSSFLKSKGACTDSRQLVSGQIFFALKGSNFDGNTYALQAIGDGAMLAVIDNEEFGTHEKCVLVPDVLSILQDLARHHRRQFNIPVIGITGSNGKTTTKELLSRVLATKYQVHCTQGNLNNHIGVPQTLLSMPKNTEVAIVEMGANHLGDIATLCDIAEPDYGLITNIGRAHIGEFGSWENIIRAKSELFDFIRKNNGTAFINRADEVLANMARRFPEGISYPNAHCKFHVADPYVTYTDDLHQMHHTHLIGAYNFINVSAAITVGKYFGVANVFDVIDEYVPDNNRSQIITMGSNQVILDAYNANPDSMDAALKSLSEMPQKTKIAILGDMKELGEYATEEHQKTVRLAKKLNLDKIYTVGEDFYHVKADAAHTPFQKMDDLIEWLKNDPIADATVLIKGSRSMEMEKLASIRQIWD